ncbi:MAG: hypothetical protein WKG52_05645 [Variovorax sp.]
MPLQKGDVLEYSLTDGMTGNKSAIFYRLDQVSIEEMTFNGGARVEKTDGRVVAIRTHVAGIFDSSSPPAGWVRTNLKLRMAWSEEYSKPKFRATVTGTDSYELDGISLQVLKIQYSGWVANNILFNGSTERAFPIESTAIYSPELKRIVRFDAETKAVAGTVRESLRLQHIFRNGSRN